MLQYLIERSMFAIDAWTQDSIEHREQLRAEIQKEKNAR